MGKKPMNHWAGTAQELAQLWPESDSNGNGYIRISRDNVIIPMHRWIWEQLVGPIPPGYEIDHENGIRTDNRLSNLRCIPKPAQRRNSCVRSDNESGVQGVSLWTTGNAWRAAIYDSSGKQILRTFSINKYGNEEAFRLACAKRKEMEAEHGYHPNHGRPRA